MTRIERARPGCRWLILLTCAWLAACAAPGQRLGESSRERLDAAFAELGQGERPGLALAVRHRGRLVYEGYFGLADLENGVPISARSRFHAGSVGKQFTAYAVLRLAAAGELDLDASVREYLPEFPEFEAPITVRHLLHHTSGLRDNLDLLAMAGVPREARIDEELLLRAVLDQRTLNHRPGAEYSYTNAGYTVLAALVRSVTGESLPDWSQEQLFEPLGLERSLLVDAPGMLIPHRAAAYSRREDLDWEPRSLNMASAGSGGLVSTPRELTQWLDYLMDLRERDPEQWAAMVAAGRLDDGAEVHHDRAHRYAAGLLLGNYRGIDYIGHDGAIAEYRTAAYLFPAHDLSVVAMLNGHWRPARDVALYAAEVVLESLGVSLQPWSDPDPYEGEIDTDLIEALRGLYAAPQAQRGERLPPVMGVGLLPRDEGLGVNVLGRPLEIAQPLGPRRFRTRQWSRLEIELWQDDAGERGARVDAGDGAQPLRPVECADDEQMQALQGMYVSAELETHYHLSFEEGRLLARHPRKSTLWLVCLTPEVYFAIPTRRQAPRGFSELELEFEDGAVVAVLLSHGPRTRQVRFQRTE